MTDIYSKSRPSGGLGRWSGRLLGPFVRSPVSLPPGADWDLWRKACQGHAVSATALVRHLTPQAYGLAMQLVRTGEDAQDIVQESFMRLWRSQATDATGTLLATYFNTIVINRCKTHLVQRREISLTHDEMVMASDDHQRTQSQDDADLMPVSAQQLQRAMSALLPRQRLALAMWAYGDADVAEIAHTLDMQPNATHQLLHRAKRALRKAFNGAQP